MTACDPVLTERVRSASRQMVRELGFMQATLAATNYPASAVHALVEIGATPAMTSAQLADLLQLEKSSVSRMVRKLIDGGELAEMASAVDARAKLLMLTAKGQQTVADIHAFATRQVETALRQLPPSQQQLVSEGLAVYASALASHRRAEPLSAWRKNSAEGVPQSGPESRSQGNPPSRPNDVQILQGYRAGLIGRIAEMHAHFYAHHFGFGQYFESLVATGAAEFAPRLARPCNEVWVALQAGRMAGSVAIDGEDLADGIAHLRWFIVDDSLRGTGAGQKLLAAALAFCDRHDFTATHLWTFQGLDAARRLYERSGFVLHDERPGRQWGSKVVEQCFIRQRPAPAA